ncbi:MAG TPA: methyltransferase domain-containing protein, partial [Gaiellaceae bacterium]|nr:methyltransferase domain-containing protein [Gaiellaceae bacterium]
MIGDGVYARGRHVTDISQCSFYHVTDLPGHGVVGWGWDLRGAEDEYLGGVDFDRKRVLELGTSSGFLCRHMERRGAEVVGYDLSDEHAWDSVPFAQCDMSEYTLEMKAYLRMQNNAWWYAHRLFGSRARAVYGRVYDIPDQIGTVDVATFGSLLLHVRDPFLALQSALRLTRETVIVTDLHPDQAADDAPSTKGRLRRRLRAFTAYRSRPAPVMRFVPDFRTAQPARSSTWWALYPELVVEMLGVLGFERTEVSFHSQKLLVEPGRSEWKSMRLFTVVGRRTRGM